MSPRPLSRGPAAYADPVNHQCPSCGGNLSRAKRRLIDRLASVFVRVHRFRCSNFSCQWEGNLRVGNGTQTTSTTRPTQG